MNTCSLTDIGNNISNFGNQANYWGNWMQLTDVNNNAMGAYLGASDRMNRGIAYNQDMNRLELNLGNGFFAQKKCPDGKPNCKENEKTITTPGREVQERLNRALGAEAGRIDIATSIDTILSTLISTLMRRAISSLSGQ